MHILQDVKSKDLLSVMVLFMDTMSRSNFIRQMAQTRDYLLNTLDAYEFSGYNKVGDNTIVNLIPALTGKYLFETGWDVKGRATYRSHSRNFTSGDIERLFSEDSNAGWSVFFGCSSNARPVFDYTSFDVSTLMERVAAVWRGKYCIGSTPEIHFYLDYLKKFALRFRGVLTWRST